MVSSEGSGAESVPDVSVKDTWEQLERVKDSVLIDVRTQAEWAFVGVPDLSKLDKRVLTIEWQRFPDSQVDARFVEKTEDALSQLGATKKDTALFFICRSGARSRAAAEAMVAAGYVSCINVAEGFEGPLNADRHRGSTAGWKASGLPWAQG